MGLGVNGGASHSVEPLRVFACGGNALPEPWGSKTILNDISNPAAQPQNCLLPSVAPNPFTQKHPLLLDEMVCLLVEPVNVRCHPE